MVGEAPGADEAAVGEPFVGTSGRFLRAILSNCGLSCNQLFFGNITQHRPEKNDIDAFDFYGPEIQSGIQSLREDLQRFRPNCVLLLGKTAFRVFKSDICYSTKKGDVVPLENWRGSVFQSADFGWKCIATYHPAYILRVYSDIPYFKFDVARAARHGGFSSISQVTRNAILRPQLSDVLSFIGRIREERRPASFDIEGFADDVGVTMYSIYTRNGQEGIVIPLWLDGKNYWSEEEEVEVWKATAQLLADPLVPKTAHNCFYELFVFAWRHSCIVNNLDQDTMMKTWECLPELERGLGVAASIWTEQSYYKDERLSSDPDVKLRYNFTDSAVTDDINDTTEVALRKYPLSLAHYRFNINLVPAYNYLMLRGCQLDKERVLGLTATVEKEVSELHSEINVSLGEAFKLYPSYDKKTEREGFNVKSPKQKCWLIYDHLKYKVLQRWGRTSDEDALLHYHAKDHNPLLRLIIRAVRKRTRLSDLNKLIPDADGRIRTSYDLVGTPTARITSRASIALRCVEGEWENTGTNLQNVTSDLRVCFIPDDASKTFWQADLAGADGWTVAAELAALGQARMLEDYLACIKPAHVLMVMLRVYEAKGDVGKINLLSRDDLKALIEPIVDDLARNEGTRLPDGRKYDWQYFCCKQVAHASNYDAQPKKISEVIFKKSDGVIDLSESEATLYQHFYKTRYNVKTRLDWIRGLLSKDGSLTASCGVRRQFYAIRDRRAIDDSIVREAASFNPQVMTTWATNKALENLWYDPQNRQSTGALFVEPLLQIHDALAGQCKTTHLPFLKTKLPVWFDNPFTVQGIKLTIPADAKYGPNWKDTRNAL